jgi:sigma-E factor negative regulatory protein RseA
VVANTVTQVTTMNHDDVLVQHEQLSALADGELASDDIGALMALEGPQAQALQAKWREYHLVGDVLRGGEASAVHASSDFLTRLQTRLAQEAPLRPDAATLASAPVQTVPVVARASEPANDASFRWKLVAGCASFTAVAVLAWSMAGGAGTPLPQTQMAAAPVPALSASQRGAELAPASQIVAQPVTLASGEAQVMLRDARLNELLAAHRQAGVSGALQTPLPTGLLRSATFEASGR